VPYSRHTHTGATHMGTHASSADLSPESEACDLRELSDPEFFAHWAAVRNRLCGTPEGKLGHYEIKRRYDAVTTEYQRRIDGEDHQ
jgi:hypothetical protein